MLFHTGYSLIDSSNTEIQLWGNALGVNVSMPEVVYLPNGDIVFVPTLNDSLSGQYKLVERWIESNPTTEIDIKVSETIEFSNNKTVVVYNYDLPNVDTYKSYVKSNLANKRWQVETGGITIDNVGYATDRESQTKYTAVAVAISQADPNTWSIDWKTNEGFVQLNAQQMMVIVNIVMNHVQSSFTKESEFITAIDSSTTVNEVMAIDIENGWPSNQFTT